MYSTVLCCALLHYTVLFSTALYCTVLYCALLHYTILFSTALFCSVMHCMRADATVQCNCCFWFCMLFNYPLRSAIAIFSRFVASLYGLRCLSITVCTHVYIFAFYHKMFCLNHCVLHSIASNIMTYMFLSANVQHSCGVLRSGCAAG